MILNPTAVPKQITIRHPTENDREMKGVYRFDDDRLVICIGAFFEERPKQFNTNAVKPTPVFVVFEREPAK